MGNGKEKIQELAPEEIQAASERKAAKLRNKFEKKESKLKRHLLKGEVAQWNAELNLLELYANYASEERRPSYEEQISQLRNHLEKRVA